MGGAKAKSDHAEPSTDHDSKKPSKAETAEAAPAAGKADKKHKAKEGKEGEVKARQVFVRERGTKWNLERCMKYAKRYKSEQEWIDGSPASYKAASYWNWVDQCCAHMPKNLRLVHSAMREAASHHPEPTVSTTVSTKPNFQVVNGQKGQNPSATSSAAKTAEATNVRKLEKKGPATEKNGSKDKKKKAS